MFLSVHFYLNLLSKFCYLGILLFKNRFIKFVLKLY